MIAVAFTMADRSTCSRRHNGAVVATYEGVVLSTGYNGSLSGMPHCNHECTCDDRPFNPSETVWVDPASDKFHHIRCNAQLSASGGSCSTAVHAEANAIYFAARHGVRTNDAVIYCTTEPCRKCAEAIIQCGITECYYAQAYKTHEGIDLLRRAGIVVHHYSKPPANAGVSNGHKPIPLEHHTGT